MYEEKNCGTYSKQLNFLIHQLTVLSNVRLSLSCAQLDVKRKSESQLAQVNMWQEKAERTWRLRIGGYKQIPLQSGMRSPETRTGDHYTAYWAIVFPGQQKVLLNCHMLQKSVLLTLHINKGLLVSFLRKTDTFDSNLLKFSHSYSGSPACQTVLGMRPGYLVPQGCGETVLSLLFGDQLRASGLIWVDRRGVSRNLFHGIVFFFLLALRKMIQRKLPREKERLQMTRGELEKG